MQFYSGQSMTHVFKKTLGTDRVETCTAQIDSTEYGGIIQHVVMNLTLGRQGTPLTICLPRHLVTQTQAPNMKPCGHQEAVTDVSSGKIIMKISAQPIIVKIGVQLTNQMLVLWTTDQSDASIMNKMSPVITICCSFGVSHFSGNFQHQNLIRPTSAVFK